MEYLTLLGDPLKTYFEEKAGSLFLRREVLTVFVTEDNRERGEPIDEANILSESLVRSSEDETDFTDRTELLLKPGRWLTPSKFSEPKADLQVANDTGLIEQYDKSKRIKQIQCNYIMRVNDVLCSDKRIFRENLSTRLAAFDALENSVVDALQGQKSEILKRLANKQTDRYSRKSRAYQTPSTKQNSVRYLTFPALDRSGQSPKLWRCERSPSPDQSFLSRFWSNTKSQTQFDFRTESKMTDSTDTRPDTPPKTHI